MKSTLVYFSQVNKKFFNRKYTKALLGGTAGT